MTAQLSHNNTSGPQGTPLQGINFPYRYLAFGLEIESQLPIPELLISQSSLPAQITIRIGDVPTELKGSTFNGRYFQTAPNKFLLRIDKVAQYLITSGNEIIICPYPTADDKDIRLFLLGSAFGALFHQMGYLPIHASAIVHNNKAILFSGNSGVGKSTLAASFLKKGYQVLTDDICMVSLSENNTPIVFPSYPHMKLWSDSIDKIGRESQTLKIIRDGIPKFSMPLNDDFYNRAIAIAGMYAISVKEAQGLTLETTKGIEKFHVIHDNIYRLNFVKAMGINPSHFKHIEVIARSCFVKKIERSIKGFHLDELSDFIENDFKIFSNE